MKNPSPSESSSPAPSRRSDAETGLAALAWAAGHGTSDRVINEVATQVRRQRQRRLRLTAGGAVALLVAGIFWQTQRFTAERSRLAPTSAVVTKPESQLLPDGSVVELNRGARIAVEFEAGSNGVRRVVLEQGEAHFQVTKDPLRPFVVVAHGVAVRAVGTAFSVQLGAQALEVLVTEGRVAVEHPSTPKPAEAPPPVTISPEPLALVNAGHRVSVELTPAAATGPASLPPPVIAVTDVELRERLVWRVPLLEFSGTPLADVIPMFNRHQTAGRSTQLVLADRALGELQVSGVLRADNIGAFLRLLQNEFGIVAEHRGDTTVLRRP